LAADPEWPRITRFAVEAGNLDRKSPGHTAPHIACLTAYVEVIWPRIGLPGRGLAELRTIRVITHRSAVSGDPCGEVPDNYSQCGIAGWATYPG
jgi:hypothetical protein